MARKASQMIIPNLAGGGLSGPGPKESTQGAQFTAEGWYGPHVTPEASVATWSNATPRGMTNPPQSRRVKAILYKELSEFGVDFEHESWPPPNPLRKVLRHSLLVTKRPEARDSGIRYPQNSLLTLEEQRSAMPITIGTKPSEISEKYVDLIKSKLKLRGNDLQASASLPDIKQNPTTLPAGGLGGSNVKGSGMRRQHSAPGSGSKDESMSKADKKKKLRMARKMDAKGAAEIRKTLSTRNLKDGDGEARPSRSPRSGHAGGHAKTSGYAGGHTSGHAKNASALRLPANKAGGGRSGSKGGSSSDGRGGGAAHSRAEKSNASGRHGDKAATDEKKDSKAPAPPDYELNNKVEVLRSACRIHRAGVADVCRYGADVTAPGSMVLGLPDSVGVWGSDASELTREHNGAMRMAAPSKLELLPVQQKRRKKKGDEDLQISQSGLFQARYPGDPSLRGIKALTKQLTKSLADQESSHRS